jgi:hypothetical protein
VKRAFGNPHKRIASKPATPLPFPPAFNCSLKDEKKQALFPCFPACKSSSYGNLASREVVFIISIGKGSYVFFTVSQGRAFQVWRKNLPCDIRCEVFFAQKLAHPKHYPLKPM